MPECLATCITYVHFFSSVNRFVTSQSSCVYEWPFMCITSIIMVSHQCGQFYAFPGHSNVGNIFHMYYKCAVSYKCESCYAVSEDTTVRMTFLTYHMGKVSHICESFHEISEQLNVHMTFHMYHIRAVSHHGESFIFNDF